MVALVALHTLDTCGVAWPDVVAFFGSFLPPVSVFMNKGSAMLMHFFNRALLIGALSRGWSSSGDSPRPFKTNEFHDF